MLQRSIGIYTFEHQVGGEDDGCTRNHTTHDHALFLVFNGIVLYLIVLCIQSLLDSSYLKVLGTLMSFMDAYHIRGTAIALSSIAAVGH